MTTCRKPETVQACFTPSNNSPSVAILHTTLFDTNGKAFSAYYHDEAGNIIDSSVFMGGGVAKIGSVGSILPKKQCWEIPGQVLTGTNAAPFIIVAGDLEIISQGGQGNALGPFVNTAGGLEFSIDGIAFDTWGNTVGGNGNQAVIDQDPLYIRNPATGTAVLFDITALTGGGSPTYAATATIERQSFDVTVYPDNTIIACDVLGNEVPFGQDWVQVECPSEFAKLCEIRDLVEAIRFGGVQTCFEMANDLGQNTAPNRFEDLDGAGANVDISTDIQLDIPTDGVILGFELTLNNLTPLVPAPATDTVISLLVNGVGTNTASTVGGVFTRQYTLDTPLPVSEGDFITIQVVPEPGGIPADLLYLPANVTQNAFLQGSNVRPMLTVIADGVQRFTKVTYADKSEQFFDAEGECIDEIPPGVIPCTTQEFSKLCDIDDKLQELIALQGPEGTENLDDFCYDIAAVDEPITGLSGTLSDGTTYEVVTDGITASSFNGTGEFYANGLGNPSPATFRIIFSAPTTVTVTPAQVPGFGAQPTPTVWHDVAGFEPSAIRNVGGDLSYTAGATVLPITDNGNEVTVAGSGTNGVSWNADWGSVVGIDSTEFEIVIVAHDRFVVNFSRPALSGKAYKQLNEDGSLVGYFDRITDEPVSASDIIECPEATQAVSIASECKNELATLIADAIADNQTTKACFRFLNDPSFVDGTGPGARGSVTVASLGAGPHQTFTATQDLILNQFSGTLFSNGANGDINVEWSTPNDSGVTSFNTVNQGGLIIPFGDVPLNQGEVLEITFTGDGSVFWNNNSDIFDQVLGAAAFGWEGVLSFTEFETITVVTDSNGVQTATDTQGNAFNAGDIPADAQEVDCDGADDVTIVGGEVSITSECKEELANLIKQPEYVGPICYEVPSDPVELQFSTGDGVDLGNGVINYSDLNGTGIGALVTSSTGSIVRQSIGPLFNFNGDGTITLQFSEPITIGEMTVRSSAGVDALYSNFSVPPISASAGFELDTSVVTVADGETAPVDGIIDFGGVEVTEISFDVNQNTSTTHINNIAGVQTRPEIRQAVACYEDGVLIEHRDIVTDGVVDLTVLNVCEPQAPTPISEPVPNTHMIEGCILSDPADPNSDKIAGFTIIGDDGAPLFAPIALTTLGFEDC